MQDFSTSLLWAEDAVAVSMRMDYRQFQAIALIERGRTCVSPGNFSSAEGDFRAALELAVQLRARFDQAQATLYLAVLMSATDQPQASDFWLDAIHLIQDNGYGFLVERERTLLLPWIARMLGDHDPILAKSSTMLLDQLMRLPPSPLSVKTLGDFTLQIGPCSVKK